MNRNYNKKTKLWLCTNGTILNSEYFKILDTNKFNLGISLDGPKEESDKYRYFDNGKSSYETTIKTIRSILNDSNLTRSFKNLWGLVVITSKTKSLIDILKHHKDIGFNSVQMKVVRTNNPELEINLNNVAKLKGLYDDLIDFFAYNISKGDVSYLKMILNDNDYFGKIMTRILLRNIVPNRCQASKNKLSLSANGDLYPCDSFVGNKDFVVGNAIHGTTTERDICSVICADRETCSKCWARFLCGGDCFHNSLLKNGDILVPDSAYCDLEKHLIELAVALLCYLVKTNYKLYERIQRQLIMEMKLN
jgi:uncharacterized protein